jgi:hypothetical protein
VGVGLGDKDNFEITTTRITTSKQAIRKEKKNERTKQTTANEQLKGYSRYLSGQHSIIPVTHPLHGFRHVIPADAKRVAPKQQHQRASERVLDSRGARGSEGLVDMVFEKRVNNGNFMVNIASC